MNNKNQIYKENLDEVLQIRFWEHIQAYIERPDLDPALLQQLLKAYQKMIDQDLKAKALQLKEKELALKARAMDQKEAEKQAEQLAEKAEPEHPGPVPAEQSALSPGAAPLNPSPGPSFSPTPGPMPTSSSSQALVGNNAALIVRSPYSGK